MIPDVFSREEKEALVRRIQGYFADELDQGIGSFDAQFLLEFLAGEIGTNFYNRGLRDARAVLERRVEDISAEIDGMERSTVSRR